MADRPYTPSIAALRAILREIEAPGTGKTQMREVMKPQPNRLNGGKPLNDGRGSYSTEGGWKRLPHAIGDRLWVRETWTAQMTHGWTIGDARSRMFNEKIFYRADDMDSIDDWWSSTQMPREFSRITLLVTDVRVQRLQDISEADARAEGVNDPDLICGFSELWDIVHGPDAWGRNDWVSATTFRPVLGNIDRVAG